MPVRLFAVLALIAFAVMPAYAQTTETTTTVVPPAETAVEESNVVGTLLGVEGTVSLVKPDAEPQPLKLNDPVHMNDVIETGAGARAFVLLIDDTELTLGENAQLTIDEYVFDEENTAANKGRYSILRGAFLYTSGLVAKKENPDVTVNTPYGAIGIRGTSFWGGDIDGEYGVLVTDGRVSVQTERGRIFVEKGQGTSLRAKTSIPARAAVWPEEKIGRAVQTIAIKDAAGIRERIGKHAEMQKEARLKHKKFLQRHHNIKADPRTPIRRIDNAPRKPEKPEGTPAIPSAPKKAEVNTPAIPGSAKTPALDDGPAVVRPPIDDNLNKPFSEETVKTPSRNVEPLLKAAPTNTPPAAATPDKGAAITPETRVPRVDLPALGQNEAHTNELKERQHIQRRQPVVRRPAAPRSGSGSRAAGAL